MTKAKVKRKKAKESNTVLLHSISKNAIALKEARDTVYWLRLLAAAEILPAAHLAGLRVEADELMRIIGAIVVSAKKNNP